MRRVLQCVAVCVLHCNAVHCSVWHTCNVCCRALQCAALLRHVLQCVSNTHTHTLSNTHTHTLSNTHTHTLSNTHTHTLSNTHTHTLSLMLRRVLQCVAVCCTVLHCVYSERDCMCVCVFDTRTAIRNPTAMGWLR